MPYPESSLKMMQYLPIQRLINPGWHQTFHPFCDPVNPIHDVAKNTQLNCRMGEALSWQHFDEKRKAARRMWNESGIR